MTVRTDTVKSGVVQCLHHMYSELHAVNKAKQYTQLRAGKKLIQRQQQLEGSSHCLVWVFSWDFVHNEKNSE